MHIHTLSNWQHKHDYLDSTQEINERRTHWVIGLTAVTMVVEITAGLVFNSMALLADGWHMASHAGALFITAFAYWYARKHVDETRFTFGTGKVATLGGYTSAVVLGVVALLMAGESIARFFDPHQIHFQEAIVVAVIGLIVNLISAKLLHQGNHHGHHHRHHKDHHQHHHGHHQDHNMRAAFLHVLADALTSVLAIIALIVGMLWGWTWLDPMMGIVGAILVGNWALGLLRDSGVVLLDKSVSLETVEKIKLLIEQDGDNKVADLHAWQIGNGHLATIVSVVTHFPKPAEHYKSLISSLPTVTHITVEVHRCPSDPCFPKQSRSHANGNGASLSSSVISFGTDSTRT